jgi:restriction system protein
MAKEPHIKVQVKHRNAAMGGPEVRNFIGTLQVGDTGIYVSTGGFTKDARYEAERSSKPLSLVDRDDLIGLYLSYYEKLDADVRTLLPVNRVYLPVTGTESTEE